MKIYVAHALLGIDPFDQTKAVSRTQRGASKKVRPRCWLLTIFFSIIIILKYFGSYDNCAAYQCGMWIQLQNTCTAQTQSEVRFVVFTLGPIEMSRLH